MTIKAFHFRNFQYTVLYEDAEMKEEKWFMFM